MVFPQIVNPMLVDPRKHLKCELIPRDPHYWHMWLYLEFEKPNAERTAKSEESEIKSEEELFEDRPVPLNDAPITAENPGSEVFVGGRLPTIMEETEADLSKETDQSESPTASTGSMERSNSEIESAEKSESSSEEKSQNEDKEIEKSNSEVESAETIESSSDEKSQNEKKEPEKKKPKKNEIRQSDGNDSAPKSYG